MKKIVIVLGASLTAGILAAVVLPRYLDSLMVQINNLPTLGGPGPDPYRAPGGTNLSGGSAEL